MYLRYSTPFQEKYERSPARVQKAMDKQAILLKENLRHPSLHAKKYDESGDLWQARVTKGWRFYFTIEGNTYNLHEIKPHPK